MVAILLVLLLVRSSAAALIEPYAGGGVGDGLPAVAAPLQPMGVAVDDDGNVYVSDQATARVRRIDATTGLVSTVVGSRYGFCGYDGPGTALCLAEPRGLSVDAAGNVLITQATGVVLRLDPATGQVTHVGGRSLNDSEPCESGDGASSTAACLGEVADVAPDASTGGVFVLGGAGRRVYRLGGSSGTATRYAGCLLDNDVQSGEGGPATEACLGHSEGLTVDDTGNVYVASLFNEGRIWRIDAATELIARVAGGGQGPTCSEDDVPATDACFAPRDVTIDAAGNLFTIGFQGSGVRRIDAATQRLTIVTPGPGEWQIDAGADGALYTAGVTQIYRIDPTAGTATPIAGNGSATFCGDGVPATQACVSAVNDIAAAADGTLFFADPSDSYRIRRVDAATHVITTVAEGGICRDAPDIEPAQVCFNESVLLASTPGGDVLVADWHGNDDDGTRQLVRRLDPATGGLTTIAGRCTTSETDGVPALDACVNAVDLVADAPGNVFLAEGPRVRRIDAVSGEIATIAGNGSFTCPAQDPAGPALAACLGAHRLALAPDGTLYIVSRGSNGFDVVLRYDAAGGTLARVAGRSDATCARVADGAPATAGCLEIQSLAVDAAGNLLVGSRGVVRLVEAGSRIVTTVAGRRPDANGFDPCCEACTNPPECLRATDLALDASGRLLTAEPEKRQVRRVTLTCGDGVLDDGEECDDGNLISGDGCDASCQPSRCASSLPPATCADQPVPGAIGRVFERSCRLEARLTAATTPRRIRRVQRSMAKTRRAALRLIERAEHRELLDAPCIAALRSEFE